MDMKAAQVLLEDLVCVLQHTTHLNETNALIVVIEVFKVILDQGREFALQVLEQLLELIVEE